MTNLNSENYDRNAKLRMRIAVGLVLFGTFTYVLGVKPNLFGADLSPVVGFVQIAVFLVGLALICLGGILAMNILWGDREKSIPADVGYRLVSTGFLAAAASGMADTFGFGTQPYPATPYFGAWQALGVMAGQGIIIIGFLMMIPWPKKTT